MVLLAGGQQWVGMCSCINAGHCGMLPLTRSLSHTRPKQAVLFEEEGFKCQSRYNNQIAFSVDIALLLKVRG